MVLRHIYLNTQIPTQGGVWSLGLHPSGCNATRPLDKKEPLPVKVRVRNGKSLSFCLGFVINAENVVVNIFALFTDRVFACYVTTDFQATVNVH